MTNFLGTLFLGKKNNTKVSEPAIQKQWNNVKEIWNNDHYKDFGIERLIRLFLSISQFVFPGLYIKDIAGRFSLESRKIAVEFYVLFKLLLPLIFFYCDATDKTWVYYLTIYIIIETMVYLACIIYLSDVFAKPISYRRSITLIFINYIEINLCYAVLYSYYNLNVPNFFKHKLNTDLQTIYYSFVTSATVGYGDVYPKTDTGRFVVITQIIVFIVFVGLFLNFFASKVQEASYYNPKKNDGTNAENPNDSVTAGSSK